MIRFELDFPWPKQVHPHAMLTSVGQSVMGVLRYGEVLTPRGEWWFGYGERVGDDLTLHETNIAPLKIGGWETPFLLGMA